MPKNFAGEPFCAVFQKIRVVKKFMDKREGKLSRFPSKIFCLTVPKNAAGEPFSLSLISGIEKVWMRGWGGGGERQYFSSKIFCLTVPKNFAGEPFCAVFQKISGSESLWIRGGGYQDFPSKIFCLTGPKNFVGEPLSISLISGIEKC